MAHEYRVTLKPLLHNGKWKYLKLYLHHDYKVWKQDAMDKDWKEITQKI